MRYGKVAGKNPWPATGLEWTTDSPPTDGKFSCHTGSYLGAI